MNPDEQEFIQKHINAIRVAQGEINRSIGELQSYIQYKTDWSKKVLGAKKDE